MKNKKPEKTEEEGKMNREKKNRFEPAKPSIARKRASRASDCRKKDKRPDPVAMQDKKFFRREKLRTHAFNS